MISVDDDDDDDTSSYDGEKKRASTALKKTSSAAEKSRAAEEAKIAESAAKGCKTLKFGVGEKLKAPRHVDQQEKFDDIFVTMKSEETGIGSLLEKLSDRLITPVAAPAPTSSPNTKQVKRFKGLSDMIHTLEEDEARMVEMEKNGTLSDERKANLEAVRKQIAKLYKERSELFGDGCNLEGDMEAEA